MNTIKKIVVSAAIAATTLAGFSDSDRHIVFIHGLADSGALWNEMIDLMTRNGFVKRENAIPIDYHSNTGRANPWGGGNTPIEDIGDIVNEQIDDHYARQGRSRPAKFDFVVHSMGGLVLRSMIATDRLERSQVGRVVTLASPHYGQDCTSLTTQVEQMDYGSLFMWNLANSDFVSGNDVLSVVGVGDRVVDYYAAALNGTHVAYVNKSHCASSGRFFGAGETAPAICKCDDGERDIVYRLIKAFFESGTVLSGDRTMPQDDTGAILMQVVDGKQNPVPYASSKMVKTIVGERIGEVTRFNNQSPDNAWQSGVVAPARPATWGIVKQGGGLAEDSYRFTFNKSKDTIFNEFTTEKTYPIENGKTTVATIPAENTKPLDFVFLIDSTGSMGSSINSVKNNAKRLIEEKLSNGARNCRVAIADYRDYPMSPYGDSGDYVFKLRCGFTTNATTAISALNTITANGGADTPEAVYSALANAIGMDWRPNAVKTIMLMCDAGPHDPEPWAPYYTKSKIIEMAKTLKVDDEDIESGIDDTYAGTKLAKVSLKAKRLLAAKNGESGIIGGISIYPVLTSSSSSLRATFHDLATDTEGKVIDSGSYSSVAAAVGEVIEQSVAANGFETEIVAVRETAGSVSVRVFGGSTADAASIGYQVVSGSGVNGKDFTATEGIQRLTWAEGERSYKTITIPVIADASTSNDKFFSIVLCDPSGMGLGGINVCRINLLDKDNASGEYRMGDVYVQGVARNTEMGSVTGSGFCALGSTRTLTATPKSGFVFTSWENGSTASRRSITGAEATSNAVDGVATCVASFIPLADLPLPTIETSGVVTGVVKEAFYWNLDYHSISEATMTCEGLPPGLVFADGVVSGTPTRTGRSSVTFTVKNAKGAITSRVEFVIVRASGTHVLAGEGAGEALTFSQALTFTAYALSEDSGEIGGLITIKTKKERDGVAAATVTIQPAGGKKQTIKGTISTADGTGQGALAGLAFTASGVIGTLNGYSVDGAIDASKSKDAATVALLNKFKGKSYVMALEPESTTGANADKVNGIAGFSIVFSAKGKAKVSGTMPAGMKVSVSSRLIVGSEWCCLPVVYSKTGNSLAFLLWFDREGNFDSVSGMTAWKGKGFEVKWNEDVAVSKVGNLSGTSYFHLADTPAEIGGAEVISELLPVDEAITPAATKWNIAKAKAVKLDRLGNLSYGANPSRLKLTYTAKTGMFKGSLSLYTMNRGRLKKNSVSISGIVVNGIGYGTATLKKVGCWPIVINAEAGE